MKFDVPSVVIEKLFNCGYEEQIVDIVMACETDNSREVSDIPISPSILQNSETKVILSNKVYLEYRKLVKRIVNPDTAQEVPFIMAGNKKQIDGKEYTVYDEIFYKIDDSLSSFSVRNDEKLFRKLLESKKYNAISIGHTHGNVNNQKKNNTLARTLPKDIKEKYGIRDTGLNVSIADIWQHEAFKQIVSKFPGVTVAQTIIMYNGDMVMIESQGIQKVGNIQSTLENGIIISISTGSSVEDEYKQTHVRKI